MLGWRTVNQQAGVHSQAFAISFLLNHAEDGKINTNIELIWSPIYRVDIHVEYILDISSLAIYCEF